jgi:CRISPR system Cascade subunit CasB
MKNKPFMTKTMKDKGCRDAIIKWKEDLDENRGARARLRRCREPMQVLLHSSFYQLKESLPEFLPDRLPKQSLALAAIAGLIANADKKDANISSMSFPQQLGSSKTEGGPPLMSETRFRQLIKSRDWLEFYRRMRRAIKMAKSNVNILSIADFVLQFGIEQQGFISHEPSHGFQFRFAEDYFEARLKKAKTKGKKEAS